jgi:hypothetical protein
MLGSVLILAGVVAVTTAKGKKEIVPAGNAQPAERAAAD